MQERLDLVELNNRDIESGLDVRHLARDPVLLSLEQIERNSTRVVRLQQPGPLIGQPFLLCPKAPSCGLCASTH
ncbi:hypothetical protein PP348_20350 [Mycobacteroides abscessus]|uniref:hypothetical protein n=1 Tax=Mycobacteroides abscessus TaxID=36809 RepID=UPI002101F95C|nr:hypothetical protein [Mycobacteroides abscessus]MDM2096428.1 hypothetical protein [Mycobacteroides abscessus]MDM2121159.1 hypothetical protein [Mycobacteroides abscessus]MDM2124346.1 hypothetical protein [Mycobacteroides abscessus]MDM2130531.1 hypothetical protein [Mycobacteroides abscessus]MDM2203080.1 hypothetical protein [Mycobacteroides abscessus]